MLARLVQLLNALVLDKVHTMFDSVPMYNVVNALQESNAPSPMLVATGNDALVSLLQEENALLPILVALGKDTLVRLLQELNA